MPGPEVRTTIESKLAARLAPSHLEVIDDSALHAGHSGARAGGGHYRVTVVSAAFEGRILENLDAASLRSFLSEHLDLQGRAGARTSGARTQSAGTSTQTSGTGRTAS